MDNFTPVASALGGALIGLSATILLLFNGRVAGISGIVGGLIRPVTGDVDWRLSFTLGLLGGAVAVATFMPGAIAGPATRSLPAVAVAGLLVGFGVRMGNGCTSGHGVCGLSRLSKRSLAAVLTFMTTGAITAVTAGLLGGA